MHVESGAAVYLIGSNGVGKTSLICMLAGLLPPSSTELPGGAVSVGSVTWIGGVGLVNERPSLDEYFSLGKVLGFWQLLDRGEEVSLERLGLVNLADVSV